jgi:DNA-directed RNA polymerase subunit omega
LRQPSIDELMKGLDSKYALVVAAAKRARQITDKAENKENPPQEEVLKPVSVALEEIGSGKILIESPKGGIK